MPIKKLPHRVYRVILAEEDGSISCKIPEHYGMPYGKMIALYKSMGWQYYEFVGDNDQILAEVKRLNQIIASQAVELQESA